MNQPPGLPPPGGRSTAQQPSAGQQQQHLAPRMGGVSAAPPPGLGSNNQSNQPAINMNSSLPSLPPGLQLPIPGIAQLQGVTPTASPPPPGLGAVGMAMSNGGLPAPPVAQNGHGYNMGALSQPHYSQQIPHLAISPQPTIGQASHSNVTSPQPQNVPIQQTSAMDGQGSRAQISFLVNALKDDSWERQLGDIRNLIAQNPPEMYHHLLRRLVNTAQPVIASLQQQASGLSTASSATQSWLASDRPLSGPLNIPIMGNSTVAWRVLESEARRAAKDAALAPHFAAALLIPQPPSTQPLVSLNLLQLNASYLFCLGCNILAAIHTPIIPQNVPASYNIFDRATRIVQGTFIDILPILRNPTIPFFAPASQGQAHPEELTQHEGKNLILGLYPRTQEEGGPKILDIPSAGPTTTVYNDGRAFSPLESEQRGQLIQSLMHRFSNTGIVLQALPHISPGAGPSDPKAIPFADILMEMGEALTSDETIVGGIMNRWWGTLLFQRPMGASIEDVANQTDRIVEKHVVQCLSSLVKGMERGRLVDVQGVVRGVQGINQLDWSFVIKSFDNEEQVFAKQCAGPFIQALFTLIPPSSHPPIKGLIITNSNNTQQTEIQPWNQSLPFLRILESITPLAGDAYHLASLQSSTTRLVTEQDVEECHVELQPILIAKLSNIWNVREVYDVLARLLKEMPQDQLANEHAPMRSQEQMEMQQVMDDVLGKAMTATPEFLLIGLHQVQKPWSTMHEVIVQRLLSMFMKPAPTSEIVFMNLGREDKDLVLGTAFKMLEEGQINAGRVVEIAHQAQLVDKIVHAKDLETSLDIAGEASKRGFIDMGSWLTISMKRHGDGAFDVVCDWLDRKAQSDPVLYKNLGVDPSDEDPTPMDASTYAKVLAVLRNPDAGDEEAARFRQTRNRCIGLYPRLMDLRPGADVDTAGTEVVTYSPQVEAQVDEALATIYHQYLPWTLCWDKLQAWYHSDNPEDHELFACTLHVLLDEYRFIAEYPANLSEASGKLLGSVVQERMLQGLPLLVALNYIGKALEALPTGDPEARADRLFVFGHAAISMCRARLQEFPLYCGSLVEIPHLQQIDPELVALCEAASENIDSDELDEQGQMASAVRPNIFPAIQPGELDLSLQENALHEPASSLTDRLLFIVNNLAPSNFDSKMEDMKQLFDTKYSRWFANYLVNTRITVEPNNHGLYMRMLKTLDAPILESHVLWETYIKTAELLNAEKVLTDAQAKNVLKNIAVWLGKMTVARDLPIKHKNLSLKDLLLQGYDAKRLNVVVPFVCQIMLQCHDSKVFHPPNPWFMAIIRLLSEFYHFADLRLQLKFEIEILGKPWNLKIQEDVEPSNILQQRIAAKEMGVRYAPDGRLLPPAAANGDKPYQPGPDGTSNIPSGLSGMAKPTDPARLEQLIESITDDIRFPPSNPMFYQGQVYRRVVVQAFQRALREALPQLVERAVAIACGSSRDLLLKDFSTERDDIKLQHAAHLMVTKLAASVCLVTSRDELRTRAMNYIGEALLDQGHFTPETIPEDAILTVVLDNLDAACNIVRIAAQERAVADMDAGLGTAYAARRKAMETGQHFFETQPFTQLVAQSSLPEPLRLNANGLLPIQDKVYEDFGDQSRFQVQASVINPPDIRSTRTPPAFAGVDASNLPLGEVVESSILSTKITVAQSMEKFQGMIAELDKSLQRATVDNLNALPLHHEIKMLIREIPVTVTQSASTDATALTFSQKVVQLLYKSESALARQVYVNILQRLCDQSAKVAKEVSQWLVYAEDVRKFNVPVTIALIQAGLIDLAELDAQLAKIIRRDFSPAVLDFTAGLVLEAAFSSEPVFDTRQVPAVVDALGRASLQHRTTEQVDRLTKTIQGMHAAGQKSELEGSPQVQHRAEITPRDLSDVDIRIQPGLYFLEWVRLFISPIPIESSFVPFINRLQKQGILKGEEVSSAFFRTSVSLAVEMFAKENGSPSMYHGVDALSRLIVLLLKSYSDTHGVSSDSSKTLYFAKIFTIVALTLVGDQSENGPNFDQRPYHRFFSSLLFDLKALESSFPRAYEGCLRTFANHLGSIQPSLAPGFAFSWVNIISHRAFMPRLLQAGNTEGRDDFYRVLMALFKFLNPFLQKASLNASSRALFQATLRILIVILHDFPDFLQEYYIGLCAAIPANCIQLRNVVLCAFPDGTPIPQDMNGFANLPPLAEYNIVPDIRTDYTRFLDEAQIRAPIDSYLREGSPAVSILVRELRNRIAISVITQDGSPGVEYNLTLLYAFSLYVGSSAVMKSLQSTGEVQYDRGCVEVDLLNHVIMSLDAEGQYHFLNSIVNQLRYPNAHTIWFSFYVLNLFRLAPEASGIPERIARVLVERVLAKRPHPWGLVLAYSELLNNQSYGFWNYRWVKENPELYQIFQNCLLHPIGSM
ncbi:hypothetical protein QFC22_005918 [Naganishia vaughanmartiniae]|uniref:Uncharacterized protein n=1 Tax=Naganishia vaughanmartiniae TaxID=1424756 RepID=A0ACC2WR13_9TREE|nr:hypothetical protein QFC22_005918 [Naganishia vaughanmartiniae]